MMHRKLLLNALEQYQKSLHITADEQQMAHRIIEFVQTNPHCFERDNYGHITGSVWIVHPYEAKVLLTHHKKLNRWLQLGGHADGDSNIAQVALKEALEESGIPQFTFITDTIFDIDVHPMPNKCAYHYDVRFVLKAITDVIQISDESNDVAWFDIDRVAQHTQEPSILRMNKKYQEWFK